MDLRFAANFSACLGIVTPLKRIAIKVGKHPRFSSAN
jgi:hypothetical protein